MYFLIIVPLLGMCAYASFGKTEQQVFTFVVWATAAILYAGLFWILLVFLRGDLWSQWFFGFAILASMLPGLAIWSAGNSIKNATKEHDE